MNESIKITQYPLSVTRELSDWILGVNPRLAYLMIQNGGLSYPTNMMNDTPSTKQFSITFNQECDDCFKDAQTQYETKLKNLANLSDTLNELYDQDLWDILLEFLYTLSAFVGGVDIFLALGEAFKEFGATAAELREIEILLNNLKYFLKQTIQGSADDVPYEWEKQDILINRPECIKGGSYGQRQRFPEEFAKCDKALREAASKQTRASKTFRGLERFSTELFYKLQFIARRNGMGLLKFIRIMFGKIFKYLLLIITLYGLWELISKTLDKMNERCLENQEDQRDINAQRFLAADEYYRAVAACQERGCCDEPIACKGIGGWCTRFRSGVDFTYYTTCCSGCDCGDDPDCYEAVCTTCDPNRKCPDNNSEEPTDVPPQSEGLPNYLFPSTVNKKTGCPPLPPGWQRLPDGVTPDARSSPFWEIGEIPDCPIQDIKDFAYETWRRFGGGGSGGGGGGVAV